MTDSYWDRVLKQRGFSYSDHIMREREACIEEKREYVMRNLNSQKEKEERLKLILSNPMLLLLQSMVEKNLLFSNDMFSDTLTFFNAVSKMQSERRVVRIIADAKDKLIHATYKTEPIKYEIAYNTQTGVCVFSEILYTDRATMEERNAKYSVHRYSFGWCPSEEKIVKRVIIDSVEQLKKIIIENFYKCKMQKDECLTEKYWQKYINTFEDILKQDLKTLREYIAARHIFAVDEYMGVTLDNYFEWVNYCEWEYNNQNILGETEIETSSNIIAKQQQEIDRLKRENELLKLKIEKLESMAGKKKK